MGMSFPIYQKFKKKILEARVTKSFFKKRDNKRKNINIPPPSTILTYSLVSFIMHFFSEKERERKSTMLLKKELVCFEGLSCTKQLP